MAGPWIGIDIGGTKMLCVAHWPDGRPDDVLRLSTGAETCGEMIDRKIEQFVASVGDVRGIGVSVPGLVENGRVIASDVLPQLDGWRPRGVASLPILVINDVRAALAGELDGAPSGAIIGVIVVGTGIGMAMAASGLVVEGAYGWAGELGSFPVRTASGIVKLDAIASGAAIVAQCKRVPDAIHAALDSGDDRVQRIIRAAGEAFGLALAGIIDILNPSIVALGGGTFSYRGYFDTAVAAAAAHALPQHWSACTIIDRVSEPLFVALGAARAAELAAEERR